MTHKDWEVVQARKLLGTWNLHNIFDSVSLDFFVLFSSVSCQWGQCGQSNYCSAGTSLDAFYQYRHVRIQPFYNNSRPTEFRPSGNMISSRLWSWPLSNPNQRLKHPASLQMATPARAILDVVTRCRWQTLQIVIGMSRNVMFDFLATVSNNPQTLGESSTAEFLAEEIGKTLSTFMMRPIAESAISTSHSRRLKLIHLGLLS
ncbi:putative polyketide protein [Botrytis fragariae]|uniref:Putative polyketide protein n=1 Tax=Botrytis fragariae TaxID=1964551 RepID=A0A8H6AN84_9HELO|nr:putative polyketide protein [Botrytis fragariae]KAF5870469.1 putative polyketide protein [Botrytis fragariae]